MSSIGSEWNRWDLHVHTASSYDYKYKGDDADELLCQQLIRNNVKAVAITDHWVIDKERILSLKAKAPNVVFFPGVELRTDKGANNLHIILIFSDQSDLDALSGDFDAIMLRKKAKSSSSNDTIYWTFEDVIEFAQDHDALVSIHAGRKTNGIDKEIDNSLPVNEAIKSDIANKIHFFEIGQRRDIDTYEEHVFKDIARKPMIICSDCHSPREYSPKEKLWIKADITFNGLKQCLYQPNERVYIGDTPLIIDRLKKNLQHNISSVSVKRVQNPINSDVEWFNFELPINPGMVAIIGSKGSGKSALSDIIAHLCRCRTMESASFLNDRRFRKTPKNYAQDYEATLTWADGEVQSSSLSVSKYETAIEEAQYLPQKHIEDICNDFGDAFQHEIDQVIFSYVDKSARGDARNLEDLVRSKTKPLQIQIQDLISKLNAINVRIINIEDKKLNAYRKTIEGGLTSAKSSLIRHDKSKPVEVTKPEPKDSDIAYQTRLEELNREIKHIEEVIQNVDGEIASINNFINDVRPVLTLIDVFEEQYIKIGTSIDVIKEKYSISIDLPAFEVLSLRDKLEELLKEAEAKKMKLQDSLSHSETGFNVNRKRLEDEKKRLIDATDSEEKQYQKYLTDLREWEIKKNEIIGASDIEGTVEFYKTEMNYLDNQLEDDYMAITAERDKIVTSLYKCKVECVAIYQGIYAPIQGEISSLLGELEDGISFQAEISVRNSEFAQSVVDHINQRYNGPFGRGHDAIQEIESLIRATDFNDINSVINLSHALANTVTGDLETSRKRVADIEGFYWLIFGLDYIDVSFKLKMGERNLEELSPGERGIVLLVFYLALSKESKPIIIDQPEDNLDNQSVYSKLVPCICRAKQRRQVIIVTHNPNIAVACDAEQIIYCNMNKHNTHIDYVSGAIENPEIKGHVIDVLEGTMPAFDLRRQKYK